MKVRSRCTSYGWSPDMVANFCSRRLLNIFSTAESCFSLLFFVKYGYASTIYRTQVAPLWQRPGYFTPGLS